MSNNFYGTIADDYQIQRLLRGPVGWSKRERSYSRTGGNIIQIERDPERLSTVKPRCQIREQLTWGH